MNAERTPQTPPKIERLPEMDSRPLWSVMIPAYNCIGYLQEALESVLQQALPEDQMQIEVIDDCSTDGDVGELVRRVGKGRVGYYKKEKNGGSLRNFESCINRALGTYVHILHGDDKIAPGFYTEVASLFEEYPEAGACFTAFDYIDSASRNTWPIQILQEERGIIKNCLERIAVTNPIQPPAIVVKREVYENLGSFFAVHYGEDWEMWVRIAAHYPIAYSPRFSAHYRVHGSNITTNSILSGQNIKDIEKVINIINNYLPKHRRQKLRKEAKRNFSGYFASLSDRLYHEHSNRRAALKQAYFSLRMHVNKLTVKHAVKILVKCIISYKRTSENIQGADSTERLLI
jgi:Glycosyltransferases, probably involved in cell wall biogenesis